MYGMPDGMAELLAKKYAIMQQEADNRGLQLRASANLDNVRAGLMPGEVAANIGLTKANTGLANANVGKVNADTALTNKTVQWFDPRQRAEIGLLGAQAYNYRTQGFLNNTQAADINDTMGYRQQIFGGSGANTPSPGTGSGPSYDSGWFARSSMPGSGLSPTRSMATDFGVRTIGSDNPLDSYYRFRK